MATRRFMRFGFILISSFALVFQFERMLNTHSEEGFSELASVSTSIRLSHAKELLGTAYTGSLVEKSAQLSSVNDFVEQTLQNRLNPRFKNQSRELSRVIISESQKKGFDPLFVMAVIQTESTYEPTMIGSHGEIGLMQILPDTAKWIAQKENIRWRGRAGLKDPSFNVRIGIAYMSFLRKHFSRSAHRYVSAYNMGPTNVRRLAAQSIQPHEYANRVMGNYQNIYSQLMKNGHHPRKTVASL